MEIRPAQMCDCAGILKYDRHIPVERVRACIQSGQLDVLCEGENILGILRWNLFWQSIPFLDLLFVDETCRGRGFGSAMMCQWEEAMKAMGYAWVMLSTQADETARFFYEKLGYQAIGSFLPPDQETDELMYLKKL